MTYTRLPKSGPLIGYAYDPRTQELHILVAPNTTVSYAGVNRDEIAAFLACRPARRYNYVQRELRNQLVQA